MATDTSNGIHMGGLLTGMDVNGLVEKLIELQSVKLKRYEEEKTGYENDIGAWTDVDTDMQALTDILDDLRKWDTWNQMLATSSNESKLTATADPSALNQIYSFVINRLAQAHTIATDRASELVVGGTANTDLVAAGVLAAGEEFTVEGQTITIGASETLNTLKGKINNAAAAVPAANRFTATILDGRLCIQRNHTGSTQINIANTTGAPLTTLGLLYKPPIPAGAQLWLEMTANTSPAVQDMSGHGNNGTEGGAATWTANGRYEGGYNLDAASSDYIQVAAAPDIDNYDQFSMSAWIKTTDAGAMSIMSYGDITTDAGILLRLNGGVPQAYINDGGTQVSVAGSAAINDGQWHQISITRDGANLILFVDGTAVDTVDSSGVGVITTNVNDTVEVGRRWAGGVDTQYYTGTVDEVAIFNRALSATEVEDYYTSYKNQLLRAQDAEFIVNGAVVTRSSNTSINDVIEGVSLNLKGTTTVADSLTLTIDRDRDVPRNMITEFIEKYNAAAKKIEDYSVINLSGNSPKGAKLYDYGLLSDDPLAARILNNMRAQATASKYPYLNQVNASYTYKGQTGICDSLADIGVYTSDRTNRLSITDQTKLDYMLENEFDKVAQLFRGVYDSQQGYIHGVATDFYKYSDSVTASITGDIARRISRLDEQMDETDERIAQYEDYLADYEKRLWSEFTAMENTVGNLQSGLSYLLSKLGVET